MLVAPGNMYLCTVTETGTTKNAMVLLFKNVMTLSHIFSIHFIKNDTALKNEYQHFKIGLMHVSDMTDSCMCIHTQM